MEYLLNMDDLGAPPFQETSICWKRDWNMLHDECRDETDGLGADRHDENMKRLSNPFISMSDFLETIENHPKPYAIKAICRYGSGLHDWWRREPGHDDTTTTTTAAATTTTNNNNTNTSNSNSSSSTTAPTVPRWQPWRSTSCWWCRKRRQERRSSCNHAQKCCRSRKCRATESLHMYVKLYGKRLVTVWKYLKPFEDKINQGPLPIPLPIRQQLLSLLEPR